MRIKKNDVSVDVYSFTNALGASGYNTTTYTKISTSAKMDLQSIGNNFTPALYGMDFAKSDAKMAYMDYDQTIGRGFLVVHGSVVYMVKGMRSWYSHIEAVLEPVDIVP